MLAENLNDEQFEEVGQVIYEQKDVPSGWPKIDEAAYQGLAGEIVRAIDPETESDPVTILGHTLCVFGNIIGRSAYFQVEASRHFTNENAIFIGATAKGRKGTGEEIVRRLFNLDLPTAQEWKANCVRSGLSSGEGIIYHVRDETHKDEGVKDRRLFIREPEFGRVLKTIERTGNTTSALIREAWDSGDLSLLTKNDPLRATGAHISVIGHITAEELNRYLYSTEIYNGFANRFLWLCVKRSKLLPEGGSFDEKNFSELGEKIKKAIEFAGAVKEVKRDVEAREIWINVYPTLSEGKCGHAGAILSRAEAHVMRVSLLYALMDLSSTIKADHLIAALALWEYVDASVAYLFANRTDNRLTDRICNALSKKVNGMTRTDISQLFNRHEKSCDIDAAVRMLEETGKIEIKKIGSAGRPTEMIILKDTQAKKAN